MRAIVFDAHAKNPAALRLADLPDPKPGPGEVLVDLKAAALNHLDIWVRNGLPGVAVPLPHIPGSDGAGVVAAVGEGVADLKAGDRVLLSPGMGCGVCERCVGGWDSLCDGYHLLGFQVNGTYCERIVVAARRAIRVSDRLSYAEWAAAPLVFLTAWHMLVTHGGIRPADKVLIHAAGSGIGQAAIQIAKLYGAEVFTTVGTAAKADKARRLGADHVIDYRAGNFGDEVLRITSKRGVDLLFEHIGPETWTDNLRCLAKGGRLVTCGATSGPKIEMDLRFVYMRQFTIKGSYMGSRSELLEVIRLLEAGRVKPVIDSSFELAEAAKAQAKMESRDIFGKIVLKI